MVPPTSPATEYRPIPGFEGRYDISREGEMRSLTSRYGKRKKPQVRTRQYHYRLRGDGKKGYFTASALVEAAWPDPGEVWKPIPEFGWVYEVSNKGRVRSMACGGKTGSNLPRTFPRVMSPGPDKDGYLKLSLYSGPGKRVTRRVARLVLEAFVGPCPAGCEASHIDGINTNDALPNLGWETTTKNNRRREHGTMPLGESHYNSKLTQAQVKRIRHLARMLAGELGDEMGVGKETVMAVIEGKTWKS